MSELLVLFIYLAGIASGGILGFCFGKKIYSPQEQEVNQSFNRVDDSHLSDISGYIVWALVAVCFIFFTLVVSYGY